MNLEKWLDKLERESKALKQGFYQAATKIPLYSRSAKITTIPNTLSGYWSVPSNGTERVLVTLTTKKRIPTIAQLELKASSGSVSRVRRTNYAHGAQWVICRYGLDPWQPTTYDVVVHSMLDGDLTLKNIGA